LTEIRAAIINRAGPICAIADLRRGDCVRAYG
jgi:hypothetical protein